MGTSRKTFFFSDSSQAAIIIADSHELEVPLPFDIPIQPTGLVQYHRINLTNLTKEITDNSAIVFKALVSCRQQTGCKNCTQFHKVGRQLY